FHHEKTPSFSIDEVKGFFYCYGCHIGGDAITFVMQIEHTDFKGAVKILADKYNMPMPEFKSSGNFARAKQENDRLFEMTKLTAGYYHANLVGEQGKSAREYLQKRGIDFATAKVFGLGYSLGFNQLVSYLTSNGFTLPEMEKAGLVDSKNEKYYDAMAGRLIVPIINNLKQVVAFGGRVLEKDKLPKYKNTKGTVLFCKTNELFGQHSIKKVKLEETVTSIIMVEGYMDVISLYQAGIRNVMASMGTALTKEQARLIKRYCNKVYICYDGDAAGQAATIRGLDILYQENLDVKVMSLTDNLDPDEYVRKYGKDGFLRLIAAAKPLFEFKIYKLAEQNDLTSADGRGKFAVEAMNVWKVQRNDARP
ncbi:MAG: DNA primase, partial [Clostridia bacterium]